MCWSKYESRFSEEEERQEDAEPTLEPKPQVEEPEVIAQEEREEELVSA